MEPLTSYTSTLSAPQAELLEKHLREHRFEFRTVPHARFAAARDKTNVVYYQSGKLVVQGKGTREFVEFVLEPEILREARLGYESVLDPDRLLPRIGVDESGKGDYFGPLCVAGVYVNAAVLERWEGKGVRDSKHIGSEARIESLAEMIRGTPGCVWEVVAIGNDAYNRLQAKMGSVNLLLAWGHARVIENLLKRRESMKPDPVRVISDQFARSQSTLAKALMPLGRAVELVQRHKAEEDLAVAAASILARSEFVRRLKELGNGAGLKLPKGAGVEADTAARELVARQGEETLQRMAKLHFRNTLKIKAPDRDSPGGASSGKSGSRDGSIRPEKTVDSGNGGN